MPIVAFENRNEADLTLVIEPWGDRYEIPHLATAGIRYAPKVAVEDRSYSVVSDHHIDFWPAADAYEIDIVRPSAFDKLSWDICVNGGWCGGVVNGNPMRVDDLLPEQGTVAAQEFARLVVRAESRPESAPPEDKHLSWLEAKFIEHIGGSSIDAEFLRSRQPRPFDDTK